MKTKILGLMLLVPGMLLAHAQGFINLNFAAANLSAYGTGGGLVPATNAIPGWTAYVGSVEQTTVLFNNFLIGGTGIAIEGTNSPYGGVIPGNAYTAVLQASTLSTASIAQTALIPTTAESVFFTASFPYGAGWQVTVGGQVIPVFQVGTVGSFYGAFVGDVSAFAGQSSELKFTALAAASGPTVNLYLNAISFSSSPVPEPSALGLSALGGLFLAWRRRTK